MNFEQLWEIIMDLNVWCMFKVIIEDVIVVDQIFNILMGDVVELCCDFIESNVLVVLNLDV